MNTSDAFPLKWPQGRPRTEKSARKRAPFKTSMARARDGMLAELRRLGAMHVVISTNIETYTRGVQIIPYATQTKLYEDPGVAVYYMWEGQQYSLCCDQYKEICDNMQAINKTVEAIRGIARWGTGDMMRAAFQGFKELPPAPDQRTKQWYEVLGYDSLPAMNLFWNTDAVLKYKTLAKQWHPDMPGGSIDKFQELHHAWEQAKKYFSA